MHFLAQIATTVVGTTVLGVTATAVVAVITAAVAAIMDHRAKVVEW